MCSKFCEIYILKVWIADFCKYNYDNVERHKREDCAGK